jgi:hypothetical protein
MKIIILNLLVILFSIAATFSSDTVSFAIIGDAGHPGQQTEQVRQSILKSDVKNLILPGDNIYDLSLSYDDVWSNWIDFDFPVVAIGNHHQSYPEEIAYFNMPGEYYSKKFKGIHFVVLNSDNRENIQEQSLFLEKHLKSHKRDEPLFIVFHHPPATVSYRHSWHEREDFQNLIRPILMRFSHKIDAILVGHDHQASIFSYGDIPVIVSGAIFEFFASRHVDQLISGVHAETIWRFNEGFFWVRLDVDKSNKWSWINFIDVNRNKVVCSIKIKKNKDMEIRSNCKN